MLRRSCMGGIFWMPAKNWSYLFFTLRMSSSSLSSSSSCLITVGIYNTRFVRRKRNEAAAAGDSALRRIPAVERILSAAAFAPLVDELAPERVKDAVGAHLDGLRGAR